MHRNLTNKRTKLFFQDREIGQLRLPACDRTGGRAPHLLFRYLWIFNQDPLLTNVDKLLSRKAHIRTPKWLCPNALPFAKLANQKCYRRISKFYHENLYNKQYNELGSLSETDNSFTHQVEKCSHLSMKFYIPISVISAICHLIYTCSECYTCDEKHLRRFRIAFYLSIAWLCDSKEYATRMSIEQLYKD
ncbi:hypothetical protein T10_7094 [Trichinella papuae]|uniref:Uncharacterized protein n=1 Tax=Trichinella papuae TaxID=268474 RepID=A0A0V1N6G8_9BILA|nr:hypothetical protein T10_7094 [Trichinella papuae]